MFSLSRVSLRRVSIISGGLLKPLSCIIQYPPSYVTPYTLQHSSSPYLLLIRGGHGDDEKSFSWWSISLFTKYITSSPLFVTVQ